MDIRQFPIHPIDEPVKTLEQAQAVMASLVGWSAIGFRDARKDEGSALRNEEPSQWVKERLSIIPGLARADEKGLNASNLIRFRHAESVALMIEEEKKRWARFPELGLAPLSSLVGFTVSYHNNGPDDPPTMSLHGETFDTPLMQAPDEGDLERQREAQRKAFSRLREHWDQGLPESPFHNILLVLANRDLQHWQADISSPQSTFESLLGPALYAEFVSTEMENTLPKVPEDAPSKKIRSRPGRL